MFKSAVIGFFSALLVVGAAYFFGLIGGSDSEPVTVSAPVSAPVAPPTLAPVESFFGTQDLGVPTPTPVNPEDAPTPPAEVVTPVTVDPEPVAQALPPCPSEDSTDCFWDAKTRGNGQGRSFENVGGEIRYTDSDSLPLIREDGWILAEDGTYVNPDFYSDTNYTPPASFLPEVREDGWILAEDGTYVNPNFYDDVAPVTIDGWVQSPDGSWLNTDSDSDPIIAPTAPVVPSEPVSAPVQTPAPVTDPVAYEPVNVEPEVTTVPGIAESELTPLVWDQTPGEIAGEISSPTVDIPGDSGTVAPTE